MSFGLEVFGPDNNLMFSAGRRYLKLVGEQLYPAELLGTNNYLVAVSRASVTLSLPEEVRVDKGLFIVFSGEDNTGDIISISGRTVVIRRPFKIVSFNNYGTLPTRVVYGYYA